MTIVVMELVPASQIVFIHAHLGDVEWPGVVEHINATIPLRLNIVRAKLGLLEMVEKRGMWPSPKFRYCTSDAKRGPLSVFIRAEMKRRGATIAVDCIGLRAEESKNRAAKIPFGLKNFLTTKSRTVYEWLPVFDLTQDEVFATIKNAGQEPHWAYKAGSTRLSCMFCIMSSKADLRRGAEENPALLKRYMAIERKIQHTVFLHKGQPISLSAHIGSA